MRCDIAQRSGRWPSPASSAFSRTGTPPFSNWAASFGEDLVVGVLLWLVVAHPVAALVVAALVVIAAALLATWIYRMMRGLFSRRVTAPG